MIDPDRIELLKQGLEDHEIDTVDQLIQERNIARDMLHAVMKERDIAKDAFAIINTRLDIAIKLINELYSTLWRALGMSPNISIGDLEILVKTHKTIKQVETTDE